MQTKVQSTDNGGEEKWPRLLRFRAFDEVCGVMMLRCLFFDFDKPTIDTILKKYFDIDFRHRYLEVSK